MNKIHRSLENKNKKIVELKVVKADLNCQIIEKDKEIIEVREALEPSKNDTQDA